MKKSRQMAFNFVLDHLENLQPVVRPMFGCHAVYVGEKILLITRDKGGSDQDDGVWLATRVEHHHSLRKEFASLRSIRILGDGGETNWQIIPKDSETFEEEVLQVIDAIKRGDPRIGTIPKRKNPPALRKKPTRKH